MQSEHKTGISRKATKQYSSVVGELNLAIGAQPQTAASEDDDRINSISALRYLISLSKVVLNKSSAQVNIEHVKSIKKRLEQFDSFAEKKSSVIPDLESVAGIVRDISSKIDVSAEKQTFKSASDFLSRMMQLNKKINEQVVKQEQDDAIRNTMGRVQAEFALLGITALSQIEYGEINDDDKLMSELKAMEIRLGKIYEASDALNMIKAYTQLIDNLLKKKTFFDKGLKQKNAFLVFLRAKLSCLGDVIRCNSCVMKQEDEENLIALTKELAIVTHHRRHSIMDNVATFFRWLLIPFFCLGLLIKDRGKADSWRAFEDFEKEKIKSLPHGEINNQLRSYFHAVIADKKYRTIEMTAADEKKTTKRINTYNDYRAFQVYCALFSKAKQPNTTPAVVAASTSSQVPDKKVQPVVTATVIAERRNTLKDMNLRVPPAAPLVPKAQRVS